MSVSEFVVVEGIAPELRVNVVALYKGKDAGPYQHFQESRRCVADSSVRPFSETQLACLRGVEQSSFAVHYKALLPRRVALLTAAVSGPVDAILSPPSDFPEQAEPFRRGLIAKFVGARDLTSSLIRNEGAKRAALDADLDAVANGLTYTGGDLGEVTSLLVVDDTFKNGTTIGALVRLLRRHGLRQDVGVVLACPLWLIPRKPA